MLTGNQFNVIKEARESNDCISRKMYFDFIKNLKEYFDRAEKPEWNEFSDILAKELKTYKIYPLL